MDTEKQNHTDICEHLFTPQTMLGVNIDSQNFWAPAANNNGKMASPY